MGDEQTLIPQTFLEVSFAVVKRSDVVACRVIALTLVVLVVGVTGQARAVVAADDTGGETTTTTEPTTGRLGIGVFLTPGEDANGDGLEQTNRLWFALEPGNSLSRTLKVSSTSVITQNVSLSTVAASREGDGRLRQEPAREDPLKDWFTFSPREFSLSPRGSQDVKITVTAPLDASAGMTENYVRVLAAGAAKSDAQYQIPTAVAFVQDAMVTVGDASQLQLDFSILDVEGFKGEGGPTLRVYFQNTGGVPISLTGTVQLASLDFEGVRSPTIDFRTPVILPDNGGFADVPMSEPVAAGSWRIFVAAFQGSYQKSATFERDLTFDTEPSGPNVPREWDIQRILIILLSLALLTFAVRNLKGKSGVASEKSETEHDVIAGDQLDEPTQGSLKAEKVIPETPISPEIQAVEATSFDPTKLVNMMRRLGARLRQNWESSEPLARDGGGSPDDSSVAQSSLVPIAEIVPQPGNLAEVEPARQEIPRVRDSADAQPNDAAAGQWSEGSRTNEPLTAEGVSTAVQPHVAPPTAGSEKLVSNAEALRVLKALLDEGVITADEYTRKCRDILERF